MIYMPAINLRKEYYDTLIRQGKDPSKVVDELVEKYLRGEEQ